jgi:sugar lactone lactonase YvrE
MTTRPRRRTLLALCVTACAAVFTTGAGAVTGTDIITTIAGTGTEGFSGDGGQASAAELQLPFGVAVDDAGNVFIADTRNHRIRKVTPAGLISTVAGTGTAGFSGDNGPATNAQLSGPIFVAVDSAGNLYVADQGNNRVRKVTPAGIITTVAGRSGPSLPPPPPGASVPASSVNLNLPTGIAVDGAGNLYIADQANRVVRKVSGGMMTTVAGTEGVAGDSGDGGQATAARLGNPCGLAVDAAGSIYIGDVGFHRVRKVAGGVITTVAGTGAEGFAGDGGQAIAAQVNDPCGVAVDNAGNLYIADVDNNRIRMVAPGGVITTVAGKGTRGATGDNGPAASAELDLPRGVAVSGAGHLYIGDTVNNRIRRVAPATAPPAAAPAPAGPGAGTAPEVEIVAVSAGRNRLGKRVVRLELSVQENLSAVLTLVRRGGTLATKQFGAVKPGERVLMLRVPAGTAKGRATLRFQLTDTEGSTMAGQRRVRIGNP